MVATIYVTLKVEVNWQINLKFWRCVLSCLVPFPMKLCNCLDNLYCVKVQQITTKLFGFWYSFPFHMYLLGMYLITYQLELNLTPLALSIYRRLPLISPGFIHLRKGF